MAILSEEELQRRKKDAHESEVRQNVKSHCTKIRDGIRKNGSTSGNRAIWELFQNAGDLVRSGNAEIKITLADDSFVFSHKGKSFTYDSLCSLVKQVSSQEKENDDTIGQYGTGFLTTHKFSRRIKVNGSMLISEEPIAYVDINDFLINRENFDNIPRFIDDMKNQILEVEKLMDVEQKEQARDWTTLSYELNEERLKIAQNAIDEAIKLMPFVLTFNDKIGSCTIEDITRNRNITFTKHDKECSIDGLLCKRIKIIEKGKAPRNFDCYYLELHNGDSKIILPLKSETEVCSLGDVPRLFIHFPLIGPNYFNVCFLFHSHRFTPEESRDNIIVPRDNDATEKTALANKLILDEMTIVLWKYLEQYICTWDNTIKMASIHIKDKDHTEAATEAYYKDLKEKWVNEFSKLKIIQIADDRYSMSEEDHPLVLEPSLESLISENKDFDFLSTIYPYAEKTARIPCKDELMQWSKIIIEWDSSKTERFLDLESIVKYISENPGKHLHEMLKMIVAAGHHDFFGDYALLPNREGILMKCKSLRDAKPISSELYKLVKALDPDICQKMVDENYADIIELTPYNRSELRDELNSSVKKQEDECWKNPNEKRPYDGIFEKKLIELCSSFTTINGDSKRNRLMPIICRFENIEYSETYVPAWPDDASNFDLYRQAFVSLVENQMMKIQHHDTSWVIEHMDDLVMFVDNARGDDYKNFCTQYALYPDMNGKLHTPDTLKKNNKVNTELFDLYFQALNEDLKGKCVDSRFEAYYEKFAEEANQYTPTSVAKDIQNKLSADNYQDTLVLDIIDLTEKENTEGVQWRNLFKDIYDQRESIRYNLGSNVERKAINRMLKQKNPALMAQMADISERKDATSVLSALDETLSKMEHEAYIIMLGEYVESHIQKFLTEALYGYGVNVNNRQGGQDFILSKDGFEDYHIEVKSRWTSDQSVEMSSTQFERAVEIPKRYALVSLNMYNFDPKRAENNDCVELSEIYPYIKILDNIGTLTTELYMRTEEAFKGDNSEIRLNGSYTVRIPQNIFDTYPLNFNSLVRKLEAYFTK